MAKTASSQSLQNALTKSAPSNSTPSVQTGIDPYRKVQSYLKTMAPAIAEALPQNSALSPDRISRIALTTIKTNPKLLECDTQSLLGAVLQSAMLGLEPNLLGSCYFIPYKGSVSFQIGYKGLIDLVTRSGEVLSIVANPVYEKDTFVVEYGKNEVFKHVPSSNDNRGDLKGFYAYAHLRNGSFKSEYMKVSEIDKIRDKYSISYRFDKNGSIWANNYEAMAIKTVVKKLIKLLPISIETQHLLAQDETVRKDIKEEPIVIIDEVETIETEVEILDAEQERADGLNGD